jgi:hypothetical protein
MKGSILDFNILTTVRSPQGHRRILPWPVGGTSLHAVKGKSVIDIVLVIDELLPVVRLSFDFLRLLLVLICHEQLADRPYLNTRYRAL